MSSFTEFLTRFLTSPDTVPLIFAEIILVVPWLFEGIAKKTIEIDKQTDEALKKLHPVVAAKEPPEEQGGKHVVFMYCEDMVWRVGLLISVTISILTILSILIIQGTTQKLSPWAGVILIIILLCTISLLLAKRNPFEMAVPFIRRWERFNGYLVGTGIVFALNAIVIALNYWKFVPTTCPP